MVGFGPTDPWSWTQGNHNSQSFDRSGVSLAVLSVSREHFAPDTDSGLPSVAPPDTWVSRALDKAQGNPLSGTHILLSLSLYRLCLVQTQLGGLVSLRCCPLLGVAVAFALLSAGL